MYVAAVSPLSSGPLSLIMAISFFLGCLVCSSLSKAFLFSPLYSPHQERPHALALLSDAFSSFHTQYQTGILIWKIDNTF